MRDDRAFRMIRAFRRTMAAGGLERQIEVSLRVYNDECIVETLWNHTRPKAGLGSQVLRHLTRLADEFAVTLTLAVQCLRYNTDNYDCVDPDRLQALNACYLDHPALITWYARYGFVADATNLPDDFANVSMTRQPSALQPFALDAAADGFSSAAARLRAESMPIGVPAASTTGR